MRRHRVMWVLDLTIVSLCVAPCTAAEPAALIEQLANPSLDVARTVSVQDVEIDLGLGRLLLEDGVLVPAAPVGDRPCEVVFAGQAILELAAPDPVEARQLVLFTGASDLHAAIERAVLVVGDPEIMTTLLDRPRIQPDPGVEDTVRKLFDEWTAGTERKGVGVHTAMVSAMTGDAAYRSFFMALLDSDDLGRFFYILDPTQSEQVSVGQFVPVEFDDRDSYQAEKAIERARRRGRLTQTRLEDLGDWDTWMQASLLDDAGEKKIGSSGFEPQRYVLEATLTPRQDQRIEGRAVLDLVAEAGGRRTLALELFSDLEPSAVRGAEGQELFWVRNGSELWILLDRSTRQGETLRLEIDYGGVVFDEVEKSIYRLRSTRSWHPHAGDVDRAVYDVTLKWPKRLELLASGRVTEERVEGDLRVERRVLDVPAFAFSFEVSDFEILRTKAGHVELTVGISKSSLAKDAGVKEELLAVLADSLVFYQEQFGPYPLDHLSVATVPRRFSQGFLGFVTLSHQLLAERGGWVVLGRENPNLQRREQRQETIAHELAHQWWGNMVGWSGYRDQWLSEALADFSAVSFMAQRAERPAAYLARQATDWRGSLNRSTLAGRRVSSLGPVVLGQRLFSSLSSTAYTAIVYDKGSVVFRMLARMLGEDELTEMLGSLAKAVGHRVIDTETFIASLEWMSGAKLSWFAEQFVYGTDIPEVYYSYDFSPDDDGRWLVEGQARQVGRAGYTYTVSRIDAGSWDVSREYVGAADTSDRILLVPFQITLDDGPSDKRKKPKLFATAYETGRGLGGEMWLKGELTRFSFPIEEQPRDFWLDQRGEVLAWFYSESREPKKMLRYRAMELPAADAEPLLRQALEAELLSEEALRQSRLSPKELEQETAREDARIHVRLARAYLELDRDDDALAELEAAEALLGRWDERVSRSERHILPCLLDLRAGRFKQAYERLEGKLRLPFPRMATDTAADDLRRNKWKSGRWGDGEDYAVLAVAAHETGHAIVAARALEEAEERGIDMSPLRKLLED